MFETTNQHWLIIIFPIKSTIVGVYPISRHPHLWLRTDTPMDADIWAAARTKTGPHHQPDDLLWYIMISLP